MGYIIGVNADQALLLLRVLGAIEAGQQELEAVGFSFYKNLHYEVSEVLQRDADDAARERFPVVEFYHENTQPAVTPLVPPDEDEYVDEDDDEGLITKEASFKRLIVTGDGIRLIQQLTATVTDFTAPGSLGLYTQTCQFAKDTGPSFPSVTVSYDRDYGTDAEVERLYDAGQELATQQVDLAEKINDNAFSLAVNDDQLRYLAFALGKLSSPAVPEGMYALYATVASLLGLEGHLDPEFPGVTIKVSKVSYPTASANAA